MHVFGSHGYLFIELDSASSRLCSSLPKYFAGPIQAVQAQYTGYAFSVSVRGNSLMSNDLYMLVDANTTSCSKVSKTDALSPYVLNPITDLLTLVPNDPSGKQTYTWPGVTILKTSTWHLCWCSANFTCTVGQFATAALVFNMQGRFVSLLYTFIEKWTTKVVGSAFQIMPCRQRIEPFKIKTFRSSLHHHSTFDVIDSCQVLAIPPRRSLNYFSILLSKCSSWLLVATAWQVPIMRLSASKRCLPGPHTVSQSRESDSPSPANLCTCLTEPAAAAVRCKANILWRDLRTACLRIALPRPIQIGSVLPLDRTDFVCVTTTTLGALARLPSWWTLG
jgi:hypothetical protein